MLKSLKPLELFNFILLEYALENLMHVVNLLQLGINN